MHRYRSLGVAEAIVNLGCDERCWAPHPHLTAVRGLRFGPEIQAAESILLSRLRSKTVAHKYSDAKENYARWELLRDFWPARDSGLSLCDAGSGRI